MVNCVIQPPHNSGHLVNVTLLFRPVSPSPKGVNNRQFPPKHVCNYECVEMLTIATHNTWISGSDTTT